MENTRTPGKSEISDRYQIKKAISWITNRVIYCLAIECFSPDHKYSNLELVFSCIPVMQPGIQSIPRK